MLSVFFAWPASILFQPILICAIFSPSLNWSQLTSILFDQIALIWAFTERNFGSIFDSVVYNCVNIITAILLYCQQDVRDSQLTIKPHEMKTSNVIQTIQASVERYHNGIIHGVSYDEAMKKTSKLKN